MLFDFLLLFYYLVRSIVVIGLLGCGGLVWMV